MTWNASASVVQVKQSLTLRNLGRDAPIRHRRLEECYRKEPREIVFRFRA